MTAYDIAKTHLGTREIPGAKNHPFILRILRRIAAWVDSEETSWCSAFVDYCAAEAGYERSGSLAARSWLEVGERIAIKDVRRGDVVIFWRVSPRSWKGHVGFVESVLPNANFIKVLGGNQNDAVTIQSFPVSRVLGFRRLRTLEYLERRGSNK